jgi:hypothetical protein
MKKNSLFKMARFAWVLVMALAIVSTSCKKDDDDDNPGDTPVIILDGVYVKGAGTALVDFDTKGKMAITRNEVVQEDRATLMELFVAVKAGAEGFNIVTVEGGTPKVWGPGGDFAEVTEVDAEEPQDGLWRGSLVESATPFTVPEDGLYHIAFDSEINVVAIARVKWGIIGGATPGGWGDNTAMDAPAFDLNTMTYTIPSVTLTEDTWKFRYSNGWKVILSPDFDLGDGNAGIKVNSNFGGTIDALVPGGDDIANATYANYTVTLTWTLGQDYTASVVYESDAEPLPEYPEAMYLVGAGTAYGWDAPGTFEAALMHKCAGGGETEGIFWKICHIEAGQGFKVSAENWGSPNLGFAEVEEFDANGTEVTDNGGNMDIAESGMYMVVLNLRDGMTKLSVTPAMVYGIGDAFGGWDEDVAANLFTVDNVNKVLVSPVLSVDGNVRMYVDHAWIPAWWNSEFNVFNGVIEYRNDGGDQEAVAGTAGQVVTLSFDDNTGTIE